MRKYLITVFLLVFVQGIFPEAEYKDKAKITYEQFVLLYESQIENNWGREADLDIVGDMTYVDFVKFLRGKFGTSFRVTYIGNTGVTIEAPPEAFLNMLKAFNQKQEFTIEGIAFYKREYQNKGLDEQITKSYEATEKLISELVGTIKDPEEKRKWLIKLEETKRAVMHAKKLTPYRERSTRFHYRLKEK